MIAALFGLVSLNAWLQVALAAVGRSDDPSILTAWQAANGVASAVAAWGSWRGARWASVAALASGIVTAAMLLALPSLLSLDTDARDGLWVGAAIILGLGIWGAWYLRRAARRAGTTL